MYKTSPDALRKTGTKSKTARKPKKIRDYLDVAEIDALMDAAPDPAARLCMMLQWRAGLRVSEAIAVTAADVHLDAKPIAELKVRQGKGKKDRLVPLHPDLARDLKGAMTIWKRKALTPLVRVSRQRVWQWYKDALAKCYWLGTIETGKPCATHTLRHSAARHWLLAGVPINVVSKWLGHANLQTTMVYSELISDPGGFMERVP